MLKLLNDINFIIRPITTKIHKLLWKSNYKFWFHMLWTIIYIKSKDSHKHLFDLKIKTNQSYLKFTRFQFNSILFLLSKLKRPSDLVSFILMSTIKVYIQKYNYLNLINFLCKANFLYHYNTISLWWLLYFVLVLFQYLFYLLLICFFYNQFLTQLLCAFKIKFCLFYS